MPGHSAEIATSPASPCTHLYGGGRVRATVDGGRGESLPLLGSGSFWQTSPARREIERGERSLNRVSSLSLETHGLREIRDARAITKETMADIAPEVWSERAVDTEGGLVPRLPKADMLGVCMTRSPQTRSSARVYGRSITELSRPQQCGEKLKIEKKTRMNSNRYKPKITFPPHSY